MQKDKEAIPEVVLLSVGEHWQQHLPGRGTAGYQWFFEIDGAKDVAEISIMPLAPPMRPASGGEAPEAGSYEECLNIHALRTGTIRLHLDQKRLWEKEGVTIRQYQVEIIVRDH